MVMDKIVTFFWLFWGNFEFYGGFVLDKVGKSSGEIESAEEPLLNGGHQDEDYSLLSCILP